MNTTSQHSEYGGYSCKPEEQAFLKNWLASLGGKNPPAISVVEYRQGWGKLGKGVSILRKPLCLAEKEYGWGLGTHADSEIMLRSNRPLRSFRALVGVDHNPNSLKGKAEIAFSVWAGGKCLAESGALSAKSRPETLAADLDGATEFTLKIQALNTIALAHADWAECEAVALSGETVRVGDPESPGVCQTLPLSFMYGDKSSEECFSQWGVLHEQKPGDGHVIHEFVSRDPETGLECRLELQEYADLPACCWRVRFKNTGTAATPVLRQVKTLDLSCPASDQKNLYRARGAFHYVGTQTTAESFRDNFRLVRDELGIAQNITLGGVGGRSSVDWMPYFNYEDAKKKCGLLFGVGWTGQWQAQIKADDDQVSFQAGMEFIHTRLLPGEEISQPSILMLRWEGDNPVRGHNLLRRFILEKLLPRHEGKTLQAPACNLTWGGMVAAHHLDRISALAREKLPLDYYWIDAGWYGKAGPNADEFSPEWGSQAGDWSINRETYPRGMKDISDAAHAAGKKFLLWVEPERAIQGTPATVEHPNWFLGNDLPKGTGILLNLGRSEARQWCTELVAGLVEEQGLDCYRQDFNIDPLSFWQAADSPERVGLTEIRYIEGLYAFLGELRRRFPHLLIDNCASGGRRLDFEMMRYSLPLWASDMQCFPNYISERNLQLVQGLSYWLQQFAFGTQEHPEDTYHFRATLAAGINIHLFSYEYKPIRKDYPYDWLRARLAEYHRAKEYFSGDFYPHCDQTDSGKYWVANQFHRPDLQGGLLLVFRKPESHIEKMRFQLQGLAADRMYEFEDADGRGKTVVSGRELLENGLPVEIAAKRDSRLYFYALCS